MEPEDKKIKWNEYKINADYIAGIDSYNIADDTLLATIKKVMKSNNIPSKYVENEILYAVKEQINWAGKMLKNKKWRKHLDSEELHVLKKIYKEGKYYNSEKDLLNNILKKYNE